MYIYIYIHVKGPKQDRSLEAPWHLRYKTFGPPELMKILLPQKSGQKESCSAWRDEPGDGIHFFHRPIFSLLIFHQSWYFDETHHGTLMKN